MNKNDYLRMIPKVDRLLKEEPYQELSWTYGRGFVTELIREELELLRSRILSCGDEENLSAAVEEWLRQIPVRIRDAAGFSLRRVWNATGIILHTNLGRAPLGKCQMEAAIQAMSGYCDLEYDLRTGSRGKRREHYAEIGAKVTGAEAVLAVNNNAAAVTLMLASIAAGKEVLVSRGELIEIGGHFRLPDVMEQSGAILREVGTTNRTRISDYESAITEATGAIMKVHTSNYRIFGFTEDASVEELAELGRKYHLPVLVDLGSGVLVNLEQFGLEYEPTVQETLKKGADLVCFSGDKLMGGPQAGIIAGKQSYIEKMEHHPMMRAIRPDKCTIAVLAATFREYLEENRAVKNLPVLAMLSRTEEELRMQAQKIKTILEKEGFPAIMAVESSINRMGGGSLPNEQIPGIALTLKPVGMSCLEMAEQLRGLPVPVIAHIKNEIIWLEMRTILPEETADFVCCIQKGKVL